jgi:anti-sigma factor RsiW
VKDKHLKGDLYDLISGRLSEASIRSAESHLKECERCRKEYEAIKGALSLLDTFEPPSLSREFKDRVIQSIYEAPLPQKPFFQRARDWVHIPSLRWSFAGAAAMVTVLLVVTVYRNFTPETKQEFRGGFEVEVEETQAPVVVEVTDMNAALSQLKTLAEAHGGKVVKRRKVNSGVEIAIGIGKEKEGTFLAELSRLGKVRVKGNDHRDKDGNVVVRLKLS